MSRRRNLVVVVMVIVCATLAMSIWVALERSGAPNRKVSGQQIQTKRSVEHDTSQTDYDEAETSIMEAFAVRQPISSASGLMPRYSALAGSAYSLQFVCFSRLCTRCERIRKR